MACVQVHHVAITMSVINKKGDKNMWIVEIEYTDRKRKEVKASNKFDAKMKYDTYINKPDVVDVAVFEDGDYIDPIEL